MLNDFSCLVEMLYRICLTFVRKLEDLRFVVENVHFISFRFNHLITPITNPFYDDGHFLLFPPISSYLPTFLFHCLNSRNAGYEKSNVSISSQKKAIRSSNRSWRVKPTKCLCLHGMNMAVVWWWSRTRWRLEILSWKKQGRIQWIWCRIFVLALWRLSAS